jgi:hypothetical protein
VDQVKLWRKFYQFQGSPSYGTQIESFESLFEKNGMKEFFGNVGKWKKDLMDGI